MRIKKSLLNTLLVATVAICGLSSFTLPAARSEVQCDLENQVCQSVNLPVYQWSDPSVTPIGRVVALPGLVFSASAYESLAKRLASQGYIVYGLEMRGFGRWAREADKFGGDSRIHWGQTRQDLLTILSYLRHQDPSLPTYLIGESFGANMAIWTMSTNPKLVDGAILSSPSFKQCIHPNWHVPIDFAKMLWRPHKPVNVARYITPYISEDREISQACSIDSEVVKKFSAADLIKAGKTSTDCWKRISEIPRDMPILVLTGKKDRIARWDKVEPTVRMFGSREATVRVLGNRGHLLIEHQPISSQVGELIDTWLAEQKTRENEGRVAVGIPSETTN